MDGQSQRQALSAAERALTLLAKGRGADAVEAAKRAVELDQIAIFSLLPEAVTHAAADLAAGGISAASWDRLAVAVGPGPLAGLVGSLRGG